MRVSGTWWRTMPDFWLNSGHALLQRRDDGRHQVTPEFLRAYLARPELQPVEESCAAEIALYDSLLQDPTRTVTDTELAALADPDAADNYRVVLAFRDVLLAHTTLEEAYISLASPGAPPVPGLFLSQLCHAILRGILSDCRDPVRLRAAEVFFRTQTVNTTDGIIMLADDEIVEMHAADGGLGGLGQLLASTGTPMKSVKLDVLDEDNAEIYWERSDRFDTVIDFRFTQPALDAFARVVEAWLAHFLALETRVQPMQRIDDEKWIWHVGLDAEATRILNGLYNGEDLSLDEANRIVALFRRDVLDRERVQPDLRGKPVYLGLAKDRGDRLLMKPQNLLVNLPLVAVA